MLRIIHTSDWHLGQELAGWSRLAEQQRALAALADAVIETRADALIVAGDVFDHQNPSAEAQGLLFDLLDRVTTARPRLTTVIVAGNHDSAGRIEAPARILTWRRVHVVGSLARRGGAIDLDRHLIPLESAAGMVEAYALAVPYLRPGDLDWSRRESDERSGAARLAEAIADTYDDLARAARARIGRRPLIATGHLTVAGATLSPSASERQIQIGGEDAVPSAVLGDEPVYVALGHLHRAQTVKSASGPVVRYSGSLLPLSAAERGYDHGVTLVEVDRNGGVRCEHIPLPHPAPFLRIPASGHLPLTEVEAALASAGLDAGLPEDRWPFVELGIAIEGPAPSLRAELDTLLQSHAIRPLAPDFRRPTGVAGQASSAPSRRLAELDPRDLFTAAFARQHGCDPGPEHLQAFAEALEGARAC